MHFDETEYALESVYMVMPYSERMRWLLAILTLLVGLASFAQAHESDSDGAAAPDSSSSSSSSTRPEVRSTEVDWNGLMWQSSLFLGLEHGFRVATEKGTRDMNGSFFGGYLNSLGNMHGWGDGDPFYVNYVGHPMQGAVTSFIWVQNDLRYRNAEFGKNRHYWKSRLRAAAWSWAYSTQFEIGPLSEASIGHIQNSYPQQGFVDHIVTPVVGTGWQIAEDALDKYVIQRFEARFENRYARLMMRSWLNPSRSLANALAFRAPWHRDARSGVNIYAASNFIDRAPKPAPASNNEQYPLLAPFEFSAVTKVQRFSGVNQYCAGGGANAAFRVAPSWQIVVDVTGCGFLGFGTPGQSGDSLSYLIGPRWTPAASKRWSPYAEFLVGGNKITHEILDQEKQAAFESDPKNLEGNRPPYPEFGDHKESNNFMVSAATGLDVRLTPAIALRVASLGYQRSWTSPLNGMSYANGLHFSSGVVLRMGTW